MNLLERIKEIRRNSGEPVQTPSVGEHHHELPESTKEYLTNRTEQLVELFKDALQQYLVDIIDNKRGYQYIARYHYEREKYRGNTECIPLTIKLDLPYSVCSLSRADLEKSNIAQVFQAVIAEKIALFNATILQAELSTVVVYDNFFRVTLKLNASIPDLQYKIDDVLNGSAGSRIFFKRRITNVPEVVKIAEEYIRSSPWYTAFWRAERNSLQFSYGNIVSSQDDYSINVNTPFYRHSESKTSLDYEDRHFGENRGAELVLKYQLFISELSRVIEGAVVLE